MDLKKRVFTSELKGINDKEFTLTAFISTDAVDRMGEILDPKGVDLSNYRKNPVVLWAHDYTKPPIGKAMWVKRDGNGIVSKVKFANTEFAKEIFNLYKEGFLKAFSVGFIPKDDEIDDKKDARVYKKWEMIEYSAVPVPANPEALTLAMSKGLIKNEETKQLLDIPLQEFNDEEEFTEIEKEVEETETKDVNNTELLTTIDDLRKELLVKENEILELKYKLYSQLERSNKIFSEITADGLAKEIGGEVRRVIRKMQGKID